MWCESDNKTFFCGGVACDAVSSGMWCLEALDVCSVNGTFVEFPPMRGSGKCTDRGRGGAE